MTKPATATSAARPTKFRIENNVPIPAVRRPLTERYPFLDMMPSQSFFVPCEDDMREKLVARISTAARTFSKRESAGKWRYVVRSVEGGVRCWRYE